MSIKLDKACTTLASDARFVGKPRITIVIIYFFESLYKHRKIELVREGYNFENYEEKDNLYFYSKTDQNYIAMTNQMIQDVDSGKIQF